MAYSGSLPPASVHATWSESIELWSIDDDALMDISTIDEITVKLRDPYTLFDEMTLTMSNGDVTIPSTGIIQWRAEVGQMSTLLPKLYEVIIVLEDEDDTVLLSLGPMSVIE